MERRPHPLRPITADWLDDVAGGWACASTKHGSLQSLRTPMRIQGMTRRDARHQSVNEVWQHMPDYEIEWHAESAQLLLRDGPFNHQRTAVMHLDRQFVAALRSNDTAHMLQIAQQVRIGRNEPAAATIVVLVGNWCITNRISLPRPRRSISRRWLFEKE